jgi:CheY-like chemotaxis protein
VPRRSPERVVLVVDDEEIVCGVTARILTDAAFRVCEARSGSEAVALLSTLNGAVQLVVSGPSGTRRGCMRMESGSCERSTVRTGSVSATKSQLRLHRLFLEEIPGLGI